MVVSSSVFRIAALGDTHCKKTSQGDLQPLFKQACQAADVIVLCGDLTDNGAPEEAHVLVKELASAGKVATVAVLGNHDFESNQQAEVSRILQESGVIVLDGEFYEINGVGFAGVKGFAGGFGRSLLGPWGEEAVKNFVHEAVNEALKLEAALARMQQSTTRRVAVLHYSPIQATVEGERPEIFAFLGSSRLEDPINRYPVDVVFHGHAHNGQPEGRTSQGIPVLNVALPVLKSKLPEKALFRVYELNLDSQPDTTESVNAA